MAKRAELRAVYSKRERDMVYHWDRRSQDGCFLSTLLTEGARSSVLTPEELSRGVYLSWDETLRRLRATLEARGYDPDTLTISVRRKRPTASASEPSDAARPAASDARTPSADDE
jgi:hypothetical protein